MNETDKGVLRQYFYPAPNKIFSEVNRACIRFVRYKQKVPCALCSKQSKKHWTAVVRFKAAIFGDSPVLEFKRKYFAAFQPVCEDHILQPDEQQFLRLARAAQRQQTKKKEH